MGIRVHVGDQTQRVSRQMPTSSISRRQYGLLIGSVGPRYYRVDGVTQERKGSNLSPPIYTVCPG